jgi:anti-sigma regulatory factor (Ser/Thr protein kinase)
MAVSVGTARMHTRELLEKWGLMELVDDAEVVACELVTNSIKATNALSSGARSPELYDRLEVVCLCLYRFPDGLLIEAWDPRPEPPVRREAGGEDEGGRGLLLVEALSKEWGTRWPATGGKIVWARLGNASRSVR